MKKVKEIDDEDEWSIKGFNTFRSTPALTLQSKECAMT